VEEPLDVPLEDSEAVQEELVAVAVEESSLEFQISDG